MPAQCPHCSKDIPGFLSQETLEERLKSKNTKIAELETALSDSKAKVSAYDSVVADKAKLESDIGKLKNSVATARAGLSDELTPFAELAYQQSMASLPKKDQVDFGAWLASDGAKNHPVLAPHLKRETAPASNQGQQTPPVDQGQRAPVAPPATGNNGAQQAPPPGRLSAQQAQERVRALTAEYSKARTPEQKATIRQQISELQKNVSGAPSAA